ncbi:MAG: S41 family peptidase [Alkalispirochaetaceae bacterium]
MNKDPKQRAFWVGLTGALVLFLFILVSTPSLLAQGSKSQDQRLFTILEQVYQFIQNNYVDEVDSETLIQGALEGMFEALGDQHSAYLTDEELRSLTDTTSGEFGGVGMYINKEVRETEEGEPRAEGYIEVVSPIEDTPAYRAGLRAGDLIVSVEGEPTDDLSVDEVVDRLRGAPGTEVEITIRRGRTQEFPVSLERAVIQIPTVKHAMIRDRIGYLRIIQFTPHTDERIREAVESFRDNEYESMIIDLRNNPGGVLDGVVDVADLFFDGGLVVGTRGRVESENKEYRAAEGRFVEEDVPIVVLIDGGSASAAEILAGAMKDRDRAFLLGETTYGKGSVQQVRSVGLGGFRLTMARYYTPDGTYIDEKGITPHEEMAEPELSEEELESYANLRRENRITEFVQEQENMEPSDEQIERFIRQLKEEGIALSERYLRRMIRTEINRLGNRSEVYDLEYDVVLQEAVRLIESGEVPR